MSNNTNTLLAVLFTAVVMPISAQSGITCGASVSATLVTLQADLGPCPGNGLFLNSAKGNVIVNLNGHKITGTGKGNGLRIGTSNGSVTIQGPGQIKDFATGIAIQDDSVLVYNLTLKNNQTGIFINTTLTARVLYNKILGGPQSLVGVETAGALNAFVYNNTISNQAKAGVAVIGESQASVEENTITDSGTGILASPPEFICFKLRGNRISHNSGSGIDVNLKGLNGVAAQAPTNVGSCFDIEDNRVTENEQSGIILERSQGLGQVLLQNNTAMYNRVSGIAVISGIDSQVLGNVALRNGAEDLFWDPTSSPDTCWSQNVFGTSSPATLPACQ